MSVQLALEAVQSFIEAGGNVLVAIFVVTAMLWTLILERLLYFRLVHPGFVKQTLAGWKSRAEHDSWYARQVRRQLVSQVREKLNFGLPMVRTLVALCPLLGLLGTVTGMIQVFDVMAVAGNGNPRAMASGVSMATIPTMAGMVAALSGMYFSAQLTNYAQNEIRRVSDLLTT